VGEHMEGKNTVVKIITVISFFAMLLTSIYAYNTPIDGMTTKEIMASYPNLFSPDYIVKVTWIFIFLLQAAFAFYQLDLFGKLRKNMRHETMYKLRILFISACYLHIFWIIAWHYDYLALSSVIIFGLLIGLITFNKILSLEDMTISEKLFVRLPFSVYYGWITISSVTNIFTLMVSIRSQVFGIPEYIWSIIVLVLITAIVSYRTQINKDLVYCLTVIWAYVGILYERVSENAMNGQYLKLITTTIICIVVLILGAGYLILRKKKNSTQKIEA
jgi:hypothetical protein